jgi:hypothetical protein
MLQGTSYAPDEVIGLIPPLLEPATVRTVAIHALMAGCKPAYVPVVLGGVRLILREECNLNGVQGTMHGVAPLMIVNGPYAQQIGLHGGAGCFGPGFRANAGGVNIGCYLRSISRYKKVEYRRLYHVKKSRLDVCIAAPVHL